jgi:HSP20 family protein
VHIGGLRRQEEAKAAAYHRQERFAGRFARSLRLPARLDAEKVEARYENGVLSARIAKAPEARARRIAVKVA